MLRKPLWAFALSGVLVAALLGCGTTVQPSGAVASVAAGTAPLATAAVRQALAPTGVLRIGVYAGSPSSMVRHPQTGEAEGVALNLGLALSKQLGVPAKVVEYERLALVVDAVKAGEADFTFTNASEARAKVVSFTPPLIQLELGYLVPVTSPITDVDGVDRPSVRVGVSQGSSSQAALAKKYQHATLQAASSVKQAQDMLRRDEVQAFATNKAILFEMAQGLPGFKVLDGRWGLENLAIAVPQGRDAGMDYLRQFAKDMQANGQLQTFVQKAGLRGTTRPD